MKERTKYILGVAGVISSVVGIIISIPSFLKGNYTAGVIATILVVGGLVILAISFGE